MKLLLDLLPYTLQGSFKLSRIRVGRERAQHPNKVRHAVFRMAEDGGEGLLVRFRASEWSLDGAHRCVHDIQHSRGERVTGVVRHAHRIKVRAVQCVVRALLNLLEDVVGTQQVCQARLGQVLVRDAALSGFRDERGQRTLQPLLQLWSIPVVQDEVLVELRNRDREPVVVGRLDRSCSRHVRVLHHRVEVTGGEASQRLLERGAEVFQASLEAGEANKRSRRAALACTTLEEHGVCTHDRLLTVCRAHQVQPSLGELQHAGELLSRRGVVSARTVGAHPGDERRVRSVLCEAVGDRLKHRLTRGSELADRFPLLSAGQHYADTLSTIRVYVRNVTPPGSERRQVESGSVLHVEELLEFLHRLGGIQIHEERLQQGASIVLGLENRHQLVDAIVHAVEVTGVNLCVIEVSNRAHAVPGSKQHVLQKEHLRLCGLHRQSFSQPARHQQAGRGRAVSLFKLEECASNLVVHEGFEEVLVERGVLFERALNVLRGCRAPQLLQHRAEVCQRGAQCVTRPT